MRAGLKLAVCVGLLALPALALLGGCAHAPVAPKVEIHTANVAVPIGCVVDRPASPKSLQLVVPQQMWDALAIGAKAEAVKAQAGTRLNYEEALSASTAGCPDVVKTSAPVNTPPGASSTTSVVH